MEELLRAVIHSVPISKSGARALNSALIQPKGTSNMAFLDPEQTLATTMRALQVIKQVLRQNGHVYIHNANKSTQPILIAAARSCLNSNVWFATEAWKVGCLSDERLGSALFTPKHQPNRALLQNRSAPWTNSLCPSPDPVQKQKPCLESIDKLRLLARTRDRSLRSEGVTDPSQGVGFLKEVVHSETFSARLTLPGSATGPASQLSLLVVMDLSYGIDAIEEAHSHGIPTIALVNAHKDLSQITYPVLAAESHLAFHHFFLDWILKVVNLPETQ